MNEESSKSLQELLCVALNHFNNHEWYEAHDVFEEIWNSVEGDERQVIQGMLQVSVSFHEMLQTEVHFTKDVRESTACCFHSNGGICSSVPGS